jgi:hypothetical protein
MVLFIHPRTIPVDCVAYDVVDIEVGQIAVFGHGDM